MVAVIEGNILNKLRQLWAWLKNLTKTELWTIVLVLLAYVISIVLQSINYGTFKFTLLSSTLKTIVSIATVSGIIIALLQFQNTNKNRQVDLANKRFDYTINAFDFFERTVSKSLTKTISQYNTALVKFHYFEYKGKEGKEIVCQLIISKAMKTSEFANCFVYLNVLESYLYYDKMYKLQLYSNIADSISDFMDLEGFEQIEALFLCDNNTNNFVYLFKDIRDYLKSKGVREL